MPRGKLKALRTQNGTVTHQKNWKRECFFFVLFTAHKSPKLMLLHIHSGVQRWTSILWERRPLTVSPRPGVFLRGNCFVSFIAPLSVLHAALYSGSTLHAGCWDPPGDPTGTDPPHANATQHYLNGSATATRLPAHRRAHHRLLLLADGHHRHHQSGAGRWLIFWSLWLLYQGLCHVNALCGHFAHQIMLTEVLQRHW